MKPFNDATARILDHVTAGLAVGESREIANSTAFMPLVVQRLTETTFSLAHYFKQNGDLICDPDMVFQRRWVADKNGPGVWIPLALQLSTGHYTRAVELDETEQPKSWIPLAYAQLRQFGTMFVRNVREQQGIKPSRRGRAA